MALCAGSWRCLVLFVLAYGMQHRTALAFWNDFLRFIGWLLGESVVGPGGNDPQKLLLKSVLGILSAACDL